jgi:two-component system cell cycle response regulator
VPSPRRGWLVACSNTLWTVLLAGLAVYALHVVAHVGGHGVDDLFNHWLYDALIVGAGLSIVLSGLRDRRGRAVWLVLGAGVLSWAAGEVYFSVALAGQSTPPVPSVADALYLPLYPASYAALMLFLRARGDELRTSRWLDGLIGGFSLAAVGTAFVLGPVLADPGNSAAEVATNLAYPVGDALLIVLAVTALGLHGWRLDRTLVVFALGFAFSAAADTLYLLEVANHTYREGTALDVLWPSAMVLLAYAARSPLARSPARAAGTRMSVVPAAALLGALAALVWDHFHRLNTLSLALAAAAIFVPLLRMVLSLDASHRALARLQERVETDPLTGVLNHRALHERLADELLRTAPDESLALLAIDIDHFKMLNDTYGHSMGDDALRTVADALRAALRPGDVLGRMGGDEFMLVLPRTAESGAEQVAARLRGAVAAARDDLTVSIGVSLYPNHTVDQTTLMRFADGAMYWSKRDGRDRCSLFTAARSDALSAVEEIDFVRRDSLLRTVYSLAAAVDAKDGYTSSHSRRVATYAGVLGGALGLDEEALNLLRTAGILHDVGKIGIPESILFKPAPLESDEYRAMQRHSTLGAEIIRGAGLPDVAKWVLYLHERYDGCGYPAGLSGQDIPLESRLLAVVDGFEALTSPRVYRPEVTSAADAIRELERCAGTQFDPAVVAAFARLVEDGTIRPLGHAPQAHGMADELPGFPAGALGAPA